MSFFPITSPDFFFTDIINGIGIWQNSSIMVSSSSLQFFCPRTCTLCRELEIRWADVVFFQLLLLLPGADWLYFGRVANHGPAPCKRGHRRNLSKRPIWTGPRRAGGRGVKAAPIGKHTGPHHDLAGRPRLHWHLSNNASPPLPPAAARLAGQLH